MAHRWLLMVVAVLAIGLGGVLTASAILPTQGFGAALLQSSTYEARAVERLGEATIPALREARLETWSGLALNPHNGVAWLRLAWIETRLDGGRLSPAAVVALQRSYDVAPYGPQITSWRTTFILDHWPEAPESVRNQLISEISAAWPHRGKMVLAAVRKAKNRQGRLAARVVIVRLRR